MRQIRKIPSVYRTQMRYFCSNIQEEDQFLTINKDKLLQYYNKKNIIQGFANKEGTFSFSQKNQLIAKDHFRTPYHDTLFLSSLGIGTYIGSPSQEDDLKMFNAIVESVDSHGINVLDTAINYRYQKSDRTMGAAIQYLINEKDITREQLFVSSKIGYITNDADNQISDESYIESLISQNKISKEDVVGEVHCMHPNFLEDQLNKTLENLQLSTLDLLYIHNASESQMPLIGEQAFFDKLAKSFEFCEKQIQNNKIKSYGLATWICFRAKLEEENIYLSLQKVHELAQSIGGPNHGFKYIQAPCSVMMPEIFSEKWQILMAENEKKKVELLKAARLLEINVFSSSPLMQGALNQVPLPEEIFKLRNNGARHLQFIRSVPAKSLLSTIVGMKSKHNTQQNLEVCYEQPLKPEEFWDFLRPPPEEMAKIDEEMEQERQQIIQDKK